MKKKKRSRSEAHLYSPICTEILPVAEQLMRAVSRLGPHACVVAMEFLVKSNSCQVHLQLFVGVALVMYVGGC